MTIQAYLVVSCHVDTFQVDKKILFPNSSTLFGTFNYPGDPNNKRFWFAHEPAKRALGVQHSRYSEIHTYTSSGYSSNHSCIQCACTIAQHVQLSCGPSSVIGTSFKIKTVCRTYLRTKPFKHIHKKTPSIVSVVRPYIHEYGTRFEHFQG